MSHTMFSKLSELIHNVDTVKAYEAAHPPELEKRTVKKKKKLKKKLKKAPAESETDAAGPSTSRPKSPVPLRQLPVGQSYQLNPSFSAMPPSAFKADYPRPVSALAASACAGPSGALSSYQLSVPARPVRPKSAMPSRPLPPAGPSARIAAEPWREVSPPKYTAASRKEPEMGTVPSTTYQAPPWKPPPNNEKETAPREEIDQPIREPRFKHVLAVPAHVLAKSYFHPSQPSDQARIKQLQQDLKVARMDRMMVIKERMQIQSELSAAHDRIHELESTVRRLAMENNSLQEQVSGLARANRSRSGN